MSRNDNTPKIITAHQVLEDAVELVNKLSARLCEPFILADSYACQVKFWYLGEPIKLLEALCNEDVDVLVSLQRHKDAEIHRTSRTLAEDFELFRSVGVEAVNIYRKYFCGSRLTHGIHNAVEILFPKLESSSKHYIICYPRRHRSFVQTALAVSEVDDLPETILCGRIFRTLPNLKSLLDANSIPPLIDVVYTWVDGGIPEWTKALGERIRGKMDIGTRDALAPARFRSQKELMYSIRSAVMYLRGLRKIYVVTNGWNPEFLQDSMEGIEFVHHRELFKNPDDLPTFNSHAIGANLHRIRGLSEKYLYINDDIFFGRTVVPSQFFDQYGRSLYFVSETDTIPTHKITDRDWGANAALRNAQMLLYEASGIFVTQRFRHTAIAIDRNLMERMEREFPFVFEKTSAAFVRSKSDYGVSGSLYCHYAAALGKGRPGEISDVYATLASQNLKAKLDNSIGRDDERARPDMICINDVLASHVPPENDTVMLQALRRAYPAPTPFETEI